jgi:hypothetical protein
VYGLIIKIPFVRLIVKLCFACRQYFFNGFAPQNPGFAFQNPGFESQSPGFESQNVAAQEQLIF